MNDTKNTTLTVADVTYTIRKRLPVAEIPDVKRYAGVVMARVANYTVYNAAGEEVDVKLPNEAFADVHRAVVGSTFQWEDLTWVLDGFYSTEDIETVDGVEYVDLELWSRIPCPAVSWCTGHEWEDFEDTDPFSPDMEHSKDLGPLATWQRPANSIGNVESNVSLTTIGMYSAPKLSVMLNIEHEYGRDDIQRLVADLRTFADRLEHLPMSQGGADVLDEAQR